MFGLKIFLRVQTFRRRPFALQPLIPESSLFLNPHCHHPLSLFCTAATISGKILTWGDPRGRPVGICRFLEEFSGFFMFLTFCFWHQDFFFLLGSFLLTRELTSLVFSRLFRHNCHNIHFHFCSVNKTGISAPLQSARDSAKMIIKIN